MDETLLRRLLGAGALLGAAMIVAALLPEPGPRDPADGVVAYDLSPGREVGAMPLPPVERPPSLKPEDRLGPARPAEQAPAAAPLPRPALKVDETLDRGGGWFVQVGSYSNQANARGALQKLFAMGLPTVIQSVSVGKTLWYRVRVGPYAAEGQAAAALVRIRKNGYETAKLVRPEADPSPKSD
jgi:cell division septation protein DedD